MGDLYTLTVLGNLSDLLGIIIVLCIIVALGLCCWIGVQEMDYLTDSEIKKTQRAKKVTKRLVVIAIIGGVLSCFTPSTKELYAIYGIGGVIDYVKSNDKAKQLPDKVIDALNKYLDEQKGE